MYVPAQSQVHNASPRARDLGHRLVQQIQEYQQQNPGTSPSDIHQALKIAQLNTGAQRPALYIAMLVGAALALALGVFAFWMGA